VPAFKVADLTRDTELILQARQDAEQLLKDDPLLTTPLNARLRAALLAVYGQTLRIIQAA